jgi:hypothetical protein
MIAMLMRFSTPRVVDRLREKALNLVRALRASLLRRDSR